MKNWQRCKEHKPRKKQDGQSERVLIVTQSSIELDGYRTTFGVYNYDLEEWLIETTQGLSEKHILYWCYIPEFTGEMKNHLKKIRNGNH